MALSEETRLRIRAKRQVRLERVQQRKALFHAKLEELSAEAAKNTEAALDADAPQGEEV